MQDRLLNTHSNSVFILLRGTAMLQSKASGPGFDSRWRPNVFNSVLFERERIHLMLYDCCIMKPTIQLLVCSITLNLWYTVRRHITSMWGKTGGDRQD